MKDRLKARIKATGKIVEVASKRKRFDFDPDEFVDLNATDLEGNYVKFYFLDELEPIIENPPQPQATISGWICRDEQMHPNLYDLHVFLEYKPKCDKDPFA